MLIRIPRRFKIRSRLVRGQFAPWLCSWSLAPRNTESSAEGQGLLGAAEASAGGGDGLEPTRPISVPQLGRCAEPHRGLWYCLWEAGCLLGWSGAMLETGIRGRASGGCRAGDVRRPCEECAVDGGLDRAKSRSSAAAGTSLGSPSGSPTRFWSRGRPAAVSFCRVRAAGVRSTGFGGRDALWSAPAALNVSGASGRVSSGAGAAAGVPVSQRGVALREGARWRCRRAHSMIWGDGWRWAVWTPKPESCRSAPGSSARNAGTPSRVGCELRCVKRKQWRALLSLLSAVSLVLARAKRCSFSWGWEWQAEGWFLGEINREKLFAG